MATRDEILTELGLAPIWRLRARAENEGTLAAGGSAALGAVPTFEPATAGTPSDDPGAREARIASLAWQDFDKDVDACVACALSRGRNKSVPGVGDHNAEWLFVGEGPGSEEDAKGEPFVGQAGKLLDNMLAAIGMKRDRNVYIANVVKCRPPNNRTPEPREIEACRPYLDRQIALLRPKLIAALGKTAATTLLNAEATIASLRGRVHRYHGVPLVVTYHPAYLLRNLPDKSKAWEDLLFARRTLRTNAGADDPEARGTPPQPQQDRLPPLLHERPPRPPRRE